MGGTFLGTSNGVLPDTGVYPGEDVWNDGIPNGPPNSASGSGGGVSDQWAMPSYQANAAGALDVVNSNSSRTCGSSLCREVPDVSASADPNSGYMVYANGGSSTVTAGWQGVGGTSAAAPLWAAFTTLTNDSAPCRALTVGFVNPALYQIAGSAYLSNFHDITGANPFTGQASNNTAYAYVNPGNPNGLYPVTSGYDMATGLGSPIVGALAASMCAVRAPVYTVSVTSPGAQTTGRGVGVSLQLASADSGGQALHLAASGLPAGLAMSPTGLITGTPTTDGQTTVTISALDAVNNAGGTTFTWNVVTPGGPKGSASGKHGKLSFSLSAGSFAPAFSSVTIKLPKGLKFGKTKKVKVTSGTKVSFKLKVKGGTLTLTFSAAIPSVTISFGKGSIKGTLKGKRKKHAAVTVTLGSAGISETGTIALKL